MEEGNIKPIDRTSIHKICSGQVVLTLATAVKELVENSIDAGATVIEVKLEECGSKLVEVSDNGKGIKSSDFQNLTLKHHTSKIADFSDLPFVSTFGFRGEALSSLCALSDLEVTTRHSDSEVGTNLKFDHNGVLIKNAPTARQVGTTIVLKNLFSTYPVRHKEFLRNVRKEFAKMIQLLSAYCLISVNKRITCTNVTDKGKKSIVLSTHNSKSLSENIVSLFGDKQMKQLMEVTRKEPTEEIVKEYFLPESSVEKSKIFNLEGYISRSCHGDGRSSSDRQFFFISGRPCDMPKISKLINEVYHTFNKHQYPFVLLNISLTEGFADVNVTPDKRQIFIPDEKVLLALVKSSLMEMYGSQPSQIMMSQLNFTPIQKNSDSGESVSTASPSLSSPEVTQNKSCLKRKFIIPTIDDDEDEAPIPSSFKSQKLSQDMQQSITKSENSEKIFESKESDISASQQSTSSNLSSNDETTNFLEKPIKPSTPDVNFILTRPFHEEKEFRKSSSLRTGPDRLRAIFDAARKLPGSNLNSESKIIKPKKKFTTQDLNANIADFLDKEYKFIPIASAPSGLTSDEAIAASNSDDVSCQEEDDSDFCFDQPSQRKKKYKNVPFNMDMFSKNIETEKKLEESCGFRKFRSKILPNDNQKAEEELKKEIKKEKFFEMDIIGQFNLGFIITRLQDDLFIIDQHATDEKYNYEQLQKETILETQKLYQPQSLNLSSVSEAILLDNINVFEMNGFKFQIDEEKLPGEKVQLVSVPVSQNWRFGKEDVDELIFMLTDNPIRMVRPSRVNQMFASRACRKSVMIGTPLTTSMMKKLISHMGEIEQPWNCPHGRPTMRHLFNLSLLNPI